MRWGIVGFGWVARDYMAPGIAAAGGRVVAVCDRDPVALEAAAALGARSHRDVGSLLRQELDAVYVATPNHLHRPVVEACLDAGVPVLCEKPVAASLEDAVAMEAAARGSGTLLAVAFDQRHHPAHVAIRDAVAGGAIGLPTAVRIVYACWLDRGWSAAQRPHDNWRIDRARAGGGARSMTAPHGLDLAGMLLGEPVVELAGFLQHRVQDYDVDDGGVLIGRTAAGILVSVHVAYNMPERLPRRRLEICGTRGQIVATNTMGQDAGGAVELIDATTGTGRALKFDASLSPFTAQARAFAAAVRGEPHDFDIARDVAALGLLLSTCAVAEPTTTNSFERQAS
jgi:1,5-anhydro-D-fructose reductase (1,5-anhydro-D-mannitol-forming)